MSVLEIKHLTEEHCFVVDFAGAQARLDYQITPALATGRPQCINFSHTFVPPALRGQGVAEKLVRTGLQWAQQQQYEIRASCWYVAKFLR